MGEHLPYNDRYRSSWALVIGINEYQHASPLGYATNDAEAVAELLRSRFAFPKENVSLLLDADASAARIRETFMAYAAEGRLDGDDRLIVFFAGHGFTATGKRGEVGFLVPADGTTKDFNTLIRWDELTRNADLIPAKHVFFLMDACYGGLALQRAPAFGSMRFLGDMLQRYARQVLTAGKADETVADGDGVRPGHSIFTAHLLDALEGSAATEEGIITANSVMAYVYDKVARDQFSHQTPHYGFLDGDGDFIFDTSILDQLRGSGSSDPAKEAAEGPKDILINPAPSLVVPTDHDAPVVAQMKDFLADKSKRIRLEDFVFLHIRRFLDAADLRTFPVQGSTPTKEEFLARVARYEEIVKDLQQIVILLAKWGDAEQLALLEQIFVRLAEADKGGGGFKIWLNLGWYPVLYLMYSAGIAALAAKNYAALRVVLTTAVVRPERAEPEPLLLPTIHKVGELHEPFKWLPGHERNHVPRSEYFLKVLQPPLEDLLLLGRRYEEFFNEFEIIMALTYADITESDLAPLGRFGWKYHYDGDANALASVINRVNEAGDEWGPLKAGLFRSRDSLTKDLVTVENLVKRASWF